MKKIKYAIIVGDREKAGEFYPDPTYDNKDKALAKIEYLKNYRIKNNMEGANYIIEKLSPERLAQHDAEWKQWLAAID